MSQTSAPNAVPWYSRAHPVVQAELAYWQKQHLATVVNWGLVGLGLLALSAFVFTGPVAIFGAYLAGEMAPLLVFAWLGVSILTGLVELALVGLASGLSAISIARERAAKTWGALRLIAASRWEIVGGKWAALFHLLHRPLKLALWGRAIGLGLAGLLFLNYYFAGLSPQSAGGIMPMPGLPGLIWGLIGVITLGGSFLPMFAIAYYGTVGLCASVLSRTPERALAGLMLIHTILGLGAALLCLPAVWLIANNRVEFWSTIFLMGLGLIGFQALSMIGLFAFTLRRAQQLAE